MIVQEMAQDVYTAIGQSLIRGVLLSGASDSVLNYLYFEKFNLRLVFILKSSSNFICRST